MVALLGGLDAEVVAIAFVFALLVGVLIIRPLLVAALGQAPFIGGWLANSVDAGLAAWERSLQAPAAAALGVLTSTIDWLTYQYSQLLATLVGLGQLTYTAVWKVTHLVIPAAVQGAENLASALVTQARAAIAADIIAAERQAAAGAAVVEARAVALTQAAELEAQRLAAAEQALAQGLFAVAEQDAAALVQAERAFVVDQIGGVEAEVQAAFSRAVAITAAAEAALQGDITTVERQVLGALGAEVDSLLRQIAADKEALSKALAGGIAGVLADIAAIRALKCIQRCAELGALGDALQLFTMAEMFALLQVILHDPQGFERDWLPGIQSLISGTLQQVRQGLGV